MTPYPGPHDNERSENSFGASQQALYQIRDELSAAPKLTLSNRLVGSVNRERSVLISVGAVTESFSEVCLWMQDRHTSETGDRSDPRTARSVLCAESSVQIRARNMASLFRCVDGLRQLYEIVTARDDSVFGLTHDQPTFRRQNHGGLSFWFKHMQYFTK